MSMALVLLMALTLNAQGTDPPRGTVAEAYRLFRAGEAAAAKTLLQDLFRRQNGAPPETAARGTFLLASILLAEGDPTQALARLDEAGTALSRFSPWTDLLRAEALIRSGSQRTW